MRRPVTGPALICGLSFLVSSAAAQEPAPKTSPVEVFAARRARLMQDCGTSGLIVLRGGPKPADMGTFYQDHEFRYLTGIDEAELSILLDLKTGEQVLFVPPFNRFTAQWDGERLAPGEGTAKAQGFDRAVANGSLKRVLQDYADEQIEGDDPLTVWTLLSPAPGRTATINSARSAAKAQRQDVFDGRPTREQAFRDKLRSEFGFKVKNIGRKIDAMRGVKDEAEIALIRAATTAAVQGIAEAMKSTEPGMFEYQIAACARYVFSRLGADEDAYAAIVGAGPNGCVLHYSANTRRAQADDLIVMDYGATVHGYATDVTRTFPANGKFSDAQRKLVSDVHEVQRVLLSHVRPGARLSALGSLCRKLLVERGYRSVHGPCHHVGLAVHDSGGDELQAGMVITVEPGAYLGDEGMGCRIEDTILITEDGYENLSGALPATPDEIEALMALPGIAQQAVGLPQQGQ